MAYGICQNKFGTNPCKKALDKEIQVADKANFVCSNPKCGMPLKEVPPPHVDPKERMKRFWKKNKNPIVVACIVLALIVSGVLMWKSCSFTPKSGPGPQPPIGVTDSTKVHPKDSVNTKTGPTVTPPEGPKTKESTIFKGKATYDAKAGKITVNATLTLTDSEGETITLHKGDVIRGVAVQGGNTLTQGEYVINGESKLFTGEVPF